MTRQKADKNKKNAKKIGKREKQNDIEIVHSQDNYESNTQTNRPLSDKFRANTNTLDSSITIKKTYQPSNESTIFGENLSIEDF